MAERERRRKATRDLPENMEILLKRVAVLEDQLGQKPEKNESSTDEGDDVEEA